MVAIYRLEIPGQGGVNNGLNSSPQGKGSIDRLINRMDSRMHKMGITQHNSNSGRDSSRPSRTNKSSKHSLSPRKCFLEITTNLGRGTKQLKGTIRVPRHLHSIKSLFSSLLEDLSLIHLTHQVSKCQSPRYFYKTNYSLSV